MYALLVAIWSSTWVAIKIGLEDAPPLLGAGARFALAGVLLGTLWIGAAAAGVAIALQMSGLLARPTTALAKAIGFSPNEFVGFGNLVIDNASGGIRALGGGRAVRGSGARSATG